MVKNESDAGPSPGEMAELAARRGFRIPAEDLLEVTAAAKRLLEAAKRIEAYRKSAEDREP